MGGPPVRIQVRSEERAAKTTKLCERFQIACQVDIGVPEKWYDLEEVLFEKLNACHVYAGCLCGSGKKYRFCCAPKVKKFDIEFFLDEFGHERG